jgi:radical SAM superfamily enzyme
MTREEGLDAGGHVILGLPGETREMLVAEADILNTLPLSYLKFHQLQIIKGTAISHEFNDLPGDFLRLGPDAYIGLLADIIERLRPDIAIGRIVSSVPPRFTDAPWGLLRPDELLKRLHLCLEERQSFQGMRVLGG